MTKPDKYVPVMTAFYREMIREMDANQHKSTWKGLGVEGALADLHYHVSKLDWAVRHRFDADGDVDARFKRRDEVREFAADVGNLCAMLLDNAGLLGIE